MTLNHEVDPSIMAIVAKIQLDRIVATQACQAGQAPPVRPKYNEVRALLLYGLPDEVNKSQ
jgi:hypothetical protein